MNNNIVFEDGLLKRNPALLAKGKIKLEHYDNQQEIIDDYFGSVCKMLYKEPKYAMKYKYLVPGGQYEDLWDWDSFFVACAVPEDGIPYAKGSVQNILESIIETTGKPPKKISPSGERDSYSFPYPIQAQFAYIVAKRVGNFDWLKPYWENLKRMRKWFDENTKSPRGYYVWLSMYGNGIDNNPAVYGRANRSSAGIDLASWHYRDIMAMYQLSKVFEPSLSEYYYNLAESLKKQIQNDYWDTMDGYFYNIDCSEDFAQKTCQEITWHVYLKFRNVASIFPLWAGVATKEQAKRIRDILMDDKEFLAPCGTRSHSKSDPVYNNVRMKDPSNWQGPVWGLTSFIAAYGLSRYGYKEDAKEIANRMLSTFASDIKQNGCVHEYYDGDYGQPLFQPEFVSWNIIALQIAKDISNGKDCTTFDMLDK